MLKNQWSSFILYSILAISGLAIFSNPINNIDRFFDLAGDSTQQIKGDVNYNLRFIVRFEYGLEEVEGIDFTCQ